MSDKIKDWINRESIKFVDIDQNYQLNIEDAEKIANYDFVVFADASVAEIDECKLEPVIPDLKTDFSMHSVTPSYILALCNNLFTKTPEVYQLHIKGYKWEFMHEISKKAEKNLDKAFQILSSFILEITG